MATNTPPVLWSDDQYEIRAAKNTDEFKQLWWKFMQELGWVCTTPLSFGKLGDSHADRI